MTSADRRYCDTCQVPILALESYYMATLPTAQIDAMLSKGPRSAPTYTPLHDGTARLELCQECVAREPGLAGVMTWVAAPKSLPWYKVG